MSLNGQLEDVSLADVMQFVHLGRRTGTLTLRRGRGSGEERAEIGFHRGQIVNAWAPGALRLGDLLVDKGLLTPETLAWLLPQMHDPQPSRSLGQVVVQTGTLAFDDVKRAIEEQIEATVYGLVEWTAGSFEFDLDRLEPHDEIAMYPGDVIPKVGLNTPRVLLEATRRRDEAGREESGGISGGGHIGLGPVGQDAHPATTLGERPRVEAPRSRLFADLEGLDVEIPEALPDDGLLLEVTHRRLQVVSKDPTLFAALSRLVPGDVATVVEVPLRDAGTRLPGEPSPTIVMLDLRSGHYAADDLMAIRRSRPNSTVIAVAEDLDTVTVAFQCGAVAAIGPDPEALSACFHSLVRTLQEAKTSVGGTGARTGFARLRRVLADIRSGLLSATMALNLMHILSDSVERAVLFLVNGEELAALGAFGFSHDEKPLAEVCRGLRLELTAGHVFSRCVSDGQPRSLGFDHAQLPEAFADLLGRPRNGQIVVFPVLGSERVISVVYTDNGSNAQAIEDIELLELATAQVGVAFENELLRRQIDAKG